MVLFKKLFTPTPRAYKGVIIKLDDDSTFNHKDIYLRWDSDTWFYFKNKSGCRIQYKKSKVTSIVEFDQDN